MTEKFSVETNKEFLRFKRYCLGGQKYITDPDDRVNGWYYISGSEIFVHYVNGKRHNTRGPAMYWINDHGDVRCSYCLNGRYCDLKQWTMHPEVIQQKTKTIMSLDT